MSNTFKEKDKKALMDKISASFNEEKNTLNLYINEEQLTTLTSTKEITLFSIIDKEKFSIILTLI